jgi:AbrB family looped-hinge helix DNA binding protein
MYDVLYRRRIMRKSIDVIVRPKRQVTLPGEICDALGIRPGDRLELVVDGDRLIARPRKRVALEALHEIRETFERYGVTEEDLQETGREIRHSLTRDRFAGEA